MTRLKLLNNVFCVWGMPINNKHNKIILHLKILHTNKVQINHSKSTSQHPITFQTTVPREKPTLALILSVKLKLFGILVASEIVISVLFTETTTLLAARIPNDFDFKEFLQEYTKIAMLKVLVRGNHPV